MSKNAPVKKIRLGLVTCAIWKNEITDKPFYTVTLQVAYKDNDGNWQNGDTLNADQLLNAAWCLQKANDFISQQ